MSRASEIAARLRAKQEAKTLQVEQVKEARAAIAAHADALWSALVAYVTESVKELDQPHLSAIKLNPNALTIRTDQLPLFSLALSYQPGRCIAGLLTEKFTALGSMNVGQIAEVRFSVDAGLQPCLTDGQRFLCPEQVGDEYLEIVGRFFEKVLEHPAILS